MKIDTKPPAYLFILPWSLRHLGGVNQVVINLAKEMKSSGTFEPIVLVTDWNAVSPIWEEVHGLKVIRWRIRPFNPSTSKKERLAFWLWKLRFYPLFSQFCREYRVAAINQHYAGPTAFTLEQFVKTCNAHPIPLLISFHGSDVTSLECASTTEIARWRSLLPKVKGVVVCSEDLGKRVVKVFGNEVVPRVIHNGLDAEAFVASTQASKIPGRRLILNVAKFEEKKGQDVLIKAFAAIANRYPDVALVLVGSTDKALTGLKEMCVGKGIEGRVHFFPDIPHEQVADHFWQATIFALPSRQEPFGLVLLEAGAFGLPVVASRVGGIPEILTDGVTARLVTPNNPEELAVCLRSLLDFPIEAQEMGGRLRQRVLSSFTWTAACEKYTALLRRQQPGNHAEANSDLADQIVSS